MKLTVLSLMLVATTSYAAQDYAAWAKKNTDGAWTAAANGGLLGADG